MPTTHAAHGPRSVAHPPTLVGWHGVLLELPPDWNLTSFSMDRTDGYLKVDSPATMFVQVRWHDTRTVRRPATLLDALMALLRRFAAMRRGAPAGPRAGQPLRDTLDAFLAQTARPYRRRALGGAGEGFEHKIKPEAVEANGERTAQRFSWTARRAGAQGQGKIWRCGACGRTVIAQVVGQGRDPVADVAAQLFGTFRCHGCDGWEVWALYDLVAAVPDDFRLRAQTLMSGRLRLEFARAGGERLTIERWGLANVTRKRFTLRDWLAKVCAAGHHRVEWDETTVQDHTAARATGRIRGPLAWLRALRDAGTRLWPASHYAGCCWECPETNKLYAIQVWQSARAVADAAGSRLLDEVAMRCECH